MIDFTIIDFTAGVAEWYGRKCKTAEKNKRMG